MNAKEVVLDELLREGLDLVKDLRAYVNERRERERNQGVDLFGPRGTQIRLTAEGSGCMHANLEHDTGGRRCKDCGQRLQIVGEKARAWFLRTAA